MAGRGWDPDIPVITQEQAIANFARLHAQVLARLPPRPRDCPERTELREDNRRQHITC